MALTGRGLSRRTKAPRAFAMYRPPICRRCFTGRHNPQAPPETPRGCSQRSRPRLAHPGAAASSSGHRYPGSEQSYSECQSEGASPPDYSRLHGAGRSPSDDLCAHMPASRSPLPPVVQPLRGFESRGMYRQPHRLESFRAFETRRVGQEGKGLTSVPSLG